MSSWRIVSGAILLVVAGAGAGALTYAGRIAAIAVAYKAKQLCSGIFVAGRDPRLVIAELEVDDLAPLRHVRAVIDPAGQSVTASAFGLIRRRAVARDETGCALVFDDAISAQRETPSPAGALSVPLASHVPAASRPVPSSANPRLRQVVERAFAEPDASRPRRTRAVVIGQEGRIAAERYAPGIGPETPLIGWSMTKAVMNALAGILVGDGRLSLHAPAPVPEWQAAGDPRRRITVDHLLRMSSGLQFDEGGTSPLSDVTRMLLGEADMGAFAIGKALDAEPGTRWEYASGTTLVLARLIRRVLGDEEYARFPRRALFEPLGMSSAVIETDASGTFVGSSFMYATARDWARLGMLYLRDGVWNGARILPERWVEYTRSPAPADPQKRYGAHFWLEVPDGYRPSAAPLPADAFHAAGHQGQFVTIVPSRGAVIVRLGGTRYDDAWDHAAFVRDVLAALDQEQRH